MFASCVTFQIFTNITTSLITPEKVFDSFEYQAKDKYADLAEETIIKIGITLGGLK
jgi:hypothetical protein